MDLTLSDGANPDEIQHMQGRRFARALAAAGRLALSPWKEAWASHATVRALVCDCFLLAERQKDISEPAESDQACRDGAQNVKPSNSKVFSRMKITVIRLRSERKKGKVIVFGEICSAEVRQRRGFQSMVRVCEQVTKASAPRGR
jgi:hypothetical protein